MGLSDGDVAEHSVLICMSGLLEVGCVAIGDLLQTQSDQKKTLFVYHFIILEGIARNKKGSPGCIGHLLNVNFSAHVLQGHLL